jgi:hypothetical protein
MRKLTPKLLAAVAGLEIQVRQQAIANLGSATTTLRGPALEAAISAEELRVLGTEVDYAHARLKAHILERLETGGLFAFHPSAPRSFNELVAEHGVSKSEASDLVTWERHIYPYLQKEFKLEPFQVWEMLGKTKRRRLTPYLRALLDENHTTYSTKVRQGVERFIAKAHADLLERASARWRADYVALAFRGIRPTPDMEVIGLKLLNDDELTTLEQNLLAGTYIAEYEPAWNDKRETVKLILDIAETSTSSDIEHQLSPERTPAIQAAVTRHPVRGHDADGVVIDDVLFRVVMSLTSDQLDMFQRRFPDRLDIAWGEGEPLERKPDGTYQQSD